MDIPRELCRYYSFDNGLKLLETSKFRLSSIFEWNDPFEFLPVAKYSNAFLFINENMTDEELEFCAKVFIQKENATLAVMSAVSEMMIYGFDGFAHKELFKMLKEYRNRMSFFRLGCLCEKTTDLLMWGHYARQHTGIVINFSSAIDFWDNNLIKVVYADNRINPYKDLVSKMFYNFSDSDIVAEEKWQRNLLITKAACWSYENEWRYIVKKDSCQEDVEGYYKIIAPNCVRDVFLGCKMSYKNKYSILEIVKEKWPNVSVYELIPDENNYFLKSRIFE